jgi:hypothetical protein
MNTNEIRSNPNITNEIEPALLDIISENPTKVFTNKQLEQEVRPKIDPKFQSVNITTHVAMGMNSLFGNQFVKKVGPGLWQSIDGPDPVYAERRTGYAPEGEYVRRPGNFYTDMDANGRKNFNLDVKGAESSVKLLKQAGYDEKKIYDTLINNSGGTKYNPVAIKVAIRKVFRLPGISGGQIDDPDIDPSIFGVDFEK